MTGLDIALLCVATFVAGFIEATVGGGGLIQVPALMLALPTASVPTLLGTSKLSSVPGLAGASITFARRMRLDWRLIGLAALAALPAGALGAMAGAHLRRPVFDQMMVVVLVAMTAWVFAKRDFGLAPATPSPRRRHLGALLAGLVVGFYEGAIGPGSGVLMVVVLVAVAGLDLLEASATAKWITLAAAVTSLVTYLASARLFVGLGLGMAAFNIAGGITGARLALVRGSAFLRTLLLVVLLGLIARLAWRAFG